MTEIDNDNSEAALIIMGDAESQPSPEVQSDGEKMQVVNQTRNKVSEALNRGKKIDVDYAGGRDSIFLSLRDDRFYSYEMDADQLHERYGGRQYYSSLTGLTGAGFLEPKPGEDDLVRFGYYRTDARGEQCRECVHEIEPEEPYGNTKQIFGYAPIASHNGIQHGSPFILTDEKTIAFLYSNDVTGTMLNWENLDESDLKEYEFDYFDIYGQKNTFKYKVYNPSGLVHHLDFRRFLDIRNIRVNYEDFETSPVLTHSVMGIRKMGDGFCHINNFDIIDGIWDEDPCSQEGPIVQGWVSNGKGMIWRINNKNIEVYFENESAEEDYEKLVRKVVPKIKWFTLTPNEWHEEFKSEY